MWWVPAAVAGARDAPAQEDDGPRGGLGPVTMRGVQVMRLVRTPRRTVRNCGRGAAWAYTGVAQSGQNHCVMVLPLSET